MNRQDIKSYPIDKTGSKFVALGDKNEDVIARIQTVVSSYGDFKAQVSTMMHSYSASFLLFDVIYIQFSLRTGRVWRIYFMNGYRGKYRSQVGIGDTVADLIVHEPLVEFDEQYLLVGKGTPYGCIMRVDNDEEDIDSLEQVMNNRITEIAVEDLDFC